MNQFIFEQLKIDFEDKVKQRGHKYKQECYQARRRGLDGAGDYAQCVKSKKGQLQQFERRGKSKLLFMQVCAKKNQNFNLVQSIVRFIDQFGLDRNKLQSI